MNDQRSFLAVLACVIFYLVYTYHLQSKYPDYGKPAVGTEAPQTASETSSPVSSPSSQQSTQLPPAAALSEGEKTLMDIKRLSAEDLRITNQDVSIQFDQSLLAMTEIKLNHYREGTSKTERETIKNLAPLPIIIQPLVEPNQTHGVKDFAAERLSEKALRFSRSTNDWKVDFIFSLTDKGYLSKIETQYTNTAANARELNAGIIFNDQIPVEAQSSGFSLIPVPNKSLLHLIAGVNGSRESEVANTFCTNAEKQVALSAQDSRVDFAGIDLHYFLKVVQPEAESFRMELLKTKPVQNPKEEKCNIVVRLWQPQGQIAPNQSVSQIFYAYLGPKDVDIMAATNAKLRETIDLGWFGMIGRPLLAGIKFLNRHITFNYGLAIILLTLLLKVVFYPLTRSAAVSMKKMQLLTPEMNRIKEKFKDDKAAQQAELMKFMAQHKINPALGCLPILPQIPVFLALFNVLSQSIELRHAPFFGWIKDLSAADPFYVTPLLLGAGMVVQQKLTPNPSLDKTQEKIMLMLPVLFTFMMISLPAGLVLYMITNTVVSILQQRWLNQRLEKLPVRALTT